METYTGDVFIIPNSLGTVDDLLFDDVKDRLREQVVALGYPGDSLLVQVWMSSKDCDNWDDHFYQVRYSKLPVAMFDGKCEGDTVEFDGMTSTWTRAPGSDDHSPSTQTPRPCHVKLTLRQLDYRYRQFGSFEKTLEDLKALYAKRAAA